MLTEAKIWLRLAGELAPLKIVNYEYRVAPKMFLNIHVESKNSLAP